MRKKVIAALLGAVMLLNVPLTAWASDIADPGGTGNDKEDAGEVNPGEEPPADPGVP